MKNKLSVSLIVGLLLALPALASAEPNSLQSLGNEGEVAETDKAIARHAVTLHSLPAEVSVKVYWWVAPNPDSAEWGPARDGVMEKLIGGTMTSPSRIATADDILLLPNGGGGRIHFALAVESPIEFALEDLSFVMKSSDDGNNLGWTFSFAGISYHPTRVGVTKTGDVLRGGSGSQKVVKFYFVGATNPYSAENSTQAQEVRNWVAQHQPFSITTTYSALIGNDVYSKGLRVPFSQEGAPALSISWIANDKLQIAISGSAGTFRLEQRTSMTGSWSAIATITSGGTHNISPDGTTRFYRAVRQ